MPTGKRAVARHEFAQVFEIAAGYVKRDFDFELSHDRKRELIAQGITHFFGSVMVMPEEEPEHFKVLSWLSLVFNEELELATRPAPKAMLH